MCIIQSFTQLDNNFPSLAINAELYFLTLQSYHLLLKSVLTFHHIAVIHHFVDSIIS
ncbi:hypothetical protein HOG21_01940 [bacterium]|nr:hypothetical protein [bacterium]